jgi:hypothetical protein
MAEVKKADSPFARSGRQPSPISPQDEQKAAKTGTAIKSQFKAICGSASHWTKGNFQASDSLT